jgi:hypothetical protein
MKLRSNYEKSRMDNEEICEHHEMQQIVDISKSNDLLCFLIKSSEESNQQPYLSLTRCLINLQIIILYTCMKLYMLTL